MLATALIWTLLCAVLMSGALLRAFDKLTAEDDGPTWAAMFAFGVLHSLGSFAALWIIISQI